MYSYFTRYVVTQWPVLHDAISLSKLSFYQLIREAQRTAPSIIYIPQISSWWEAVGPTLKAGFTGLLNNIPYFAPVLLLATSDVPHEDLPEEVFLPILFFLCYSVSF